MLSQDQIKKIIAQAKVYGTDLVDSYQKFRDENDETTKNQLKSDFNAKSEIFVRYLMTNFPAPDVSTEEKFHIYQVEFLKYCFGEGLPKEEWQKIIDGAFSYPPSVPLDMAPFLMIRFLISRRKCRLIPLAIPSWSNVVERFNNLVIGEYT